MNREELKPIELECNMGPDVNGVVHREPWKAYDIDEVDALLAKKDDEIRRLRRALWIHRAITAKFNKEGCKAMREYNPFIGIEEYKWQEVERKCLKKAEEYK